MIVYIWISYIGFCRSVVCRLLNVFLCESRARRRWCNARTIVEDVELIHNNDNLICIGKYLILCIRSTKANDIEILVHCRTEQLGVSLLPNSNYTTRRIYFVGKPTPTMRLHENSYSRI